MDFLPPILLILSRINVLDISKQQNVEILKNCLLHQDTKTERFKCLNVENHRTAQAHRGLSSQLRTRWKMTLEIYWVLSEPTTGRPVKCGHCTVAVHDGNFIGVYMENSKIAPNLMGVTPTTNNGRQKTWSCRYLSLHIIPQGTGNATLTNKGKYEGCPLKIPGCSV